MKKMIVAVFCLMAVIARAEPVPLVLQSTGYTRLLVPTSLRYQPGLEYAEWWDEETETTIIREATEGAVIIHADYRLSARVPVVDVTLEGIRTVISPKSNPVFALEITVPESTFAAAFGEGADAVIAVLQLAGQLVPNAELTGIIRGVAADILSAEEEE